MAPTTHTEAMSESTPPATTTLKSQPPTPAPVTSPVPPIRNMGPYKVAEDIYLSPFSVSDTSELHRVLNITNAVSLGLYTASVTFPFPLEGAESFTRRHESRRTERGFADAWAIRPAPEGPVMGLLGVHEFDHEDEGVPVCYHEQGGSGNKVPMRCGGVGYWLSPDATGKGIMTRVLDYGLQQLARQVMGFERVHGEAWGENVASRRVMERAGMQSAPPVECFVPKFGETKICAHYILDV
ncbi:hypothetical protein BG006_008786 [Podila minutissima]|uniref:N-acetyltransferase domain-containing protein n=1 Tax=Podila minutissima TaxID=64525 RepID=A0A9P5VJT7_9FUNG|nr:hypothetical protein BG006_008786 [Podila minutissima]